MSEQKSSSKLLQIVFFVALGSVIIYEIIIIYSSLINPLYFIVLGFFISFFFSVYYINRQRNLLRHPRSIKIKWYSSLPDWARIVFCPIVLVPLLFIIPFGFAGLILAITISAFVLIIVFGRFYLNARETYTVDSSKALKMYKNKDIIIKGLLIGFVLIPLVILYIVFLSIMTLIILFLSGIFYYLYFNRQKIKLQKKHELLILFIIILLSITPFILERTLIRKNYNYIEVYNLDSGVPNNVISISESFDYHQELNWSTIRSYDRLLFPDERILYKNKINDHKNQFFIPYLHARALFKYSFSAKPIITPVIISYKGALHHNYKYLSDVDFILSGDYFDENCFKDYCFCYFYINSYYYNPPNETIETVSFSSGFLVRIHMNYEHQISIFDFDGEEQEHIMILNDDYEILFVLVISPIIQFIDVAGCGC